MSTDFFNQFKGGTWTPPPQPTVYAIEWERQFETATPQERTNIINGWLWVLNNELQYAQDDDSVRNTLSEIVDDLYPWLRIALPYHTPELFHKSVFDGSLQCLLRYTSALPPEVQEAYAAALGGLWFSSGAAQKKALVELAKLSTVWAGSKKGLPTLRQLVPKLGWTLACENPQDKWIEATAARLSVCAGLSSIPIPDNLFIGNKAWHCLAKLSRGSTADPRVAFSLDAFDVIRQADPIVSAYNLPTLMNEVRNDTGKGSPYCIRQGVTRVFEQDVAELSDYDVLRAWIPALKSMWDASEALDLPYTQACEQAVAQYQTSAENRLALPSDLVENLGTR